MHEFIQGGELKVQAKRLLGYRIPLVLVIIVNLVLIARIPMPPSRQAQAQVPMSTEFRAHTDAQLEPPTTPVPESSSAVARQTPADDPSRPPSALASHIQLPRGAGLAFSTSPQDAATDIEKHGGSDQGSDPPELDQAPRDVVDLAVIDTVAAALANLPTMPLAAWQHDAQQLVHRWKHSAQTMLSPTESESTDAAPAVNTAPAVERPESPLTERVAERRIELGFDETCFTIRNPVANVETIRFLVNRRLCELRPGEMHQFGPAEEWLVQFHPGGEFEDVERTVTNGVYQFVVTSQGWDLVPIASDVR